MIDSNDLTLMAVEHGFMNGYLAALSDVLAGKPLTDEEGVRARAKASDVYAGTWKIIQANTKP